MELINHNPFRVAGVLSSATEKELQKRKTKVKAFSKVGKEVNSEYDFQFLESIPRTEDSIAKAFSNIEQNQDKVNFSLFWFLNASPFDNTAFEYLKNGDEEKAVEIWEKVTLDKKVNSKNFSAFNNLGTYKLLSKTQDGQKEGIEAKIKLIESDFFENFVHSVADETFTINNEKQIEQWIDQLLTQLKKGYPPSKALKLFANCNGSTQKYLTRKFTEEPIHKIEGQIESCKKKRKENKISAYKFGSRLFTKTKEDLSLLKSILRTSDLKYKAISDQLANEIMQCGIDYFNESQESDSSENYLESAQKLTKLADSIAVGKLTKDRAKDSLATLADMKDREVNHAIQLLRSIKDAHDKAIDEIDAQVSAMRMTMSYNQTIKYSKVDKMKANCLDWSKVVEVVNTGISMNDIATIQRCSIQSKVSEYKNLVDFLFSKLGPLQINQLKHICFWKDVKTAQAKSTAKKVGTGISSAAEGCYVATWVYGNYDHPQVLELRKFRDHYLSKSQFGRRFIKLYYKYSPTLVEKLKNSQTINYAIRKVLDQFIKAIKK